MEKHFRLTLRQAQALLSVSHRTHNFGSVKLSDLITDMGVSFATLSDHLAALQKQKLIRTPRDAKPRNLVFTDEIILTPRGNSLAQDIMKVINASYGQHTIGLIFEKLRAFYEPRGYQLDLFRNKTKTDSFAKAFEKLISKNPSEPVLTSIAMYTDLDGQLSLMRRKDEDKYKLLSRAKLNLEIRNGRLASIAIPTAIRGSTRLTDLLNILGTSWSWMGTVNKTSNKRYWQEAMSLGLLQVRGDLLTSTKPTAIDTVSWLANKTYFTFINTIPIAPKSSLVLFRESFKFPTLDDVMNPKDSDVELEWLDFIWDNMNDKSDYVDTIREGLDILKENANLLQEYEGRLIPTTIIRKIDKDSDLKTVFKTIIKQSDTIVSKILIAVSAKPAVSIYELYSDLNKKAKDKISLKEIEETVSVLVANNLIHIATTRAAMESSTRLYSFIHLPFLTSKAGDSKETNAVLRSMKPYLLQRMEELFRSPQEKESIYNIFAGLMRDDYVDLEHVEKEYGKTTSRKLLLFGDSLEPFIRIDDDYSGFILNRENVGLNNILINSLLYSVLTQNDALSMYSQTISDLVEKDIPWAQEVAVESKALVSDLIEQNMN